MAARATKSTPASTPAKVTPIKAPAAPAADAPSAPATARPVLDLAALAAGAKVVDTLPTASVINTDRGANPFMALIKAAMAEDKPRVVGPIPFVMEDGEQVVDAKAMTRITNSLRNAASKLGVSAEIRKVKVADGIDVYFTGVAKPAKDTAKS
jgi:hypothetical protein